MDAPHEGLDQRHVDHQYVGWPPGADGAFDEAQPFLGLTGGRARLDGVDAPR